MIRTNVIPCLSSGLAKNNKIMSLFVLFSRHFWPFWKFGFFRKCSDKTYTASTYRRFLPTENCFWRGVVAMSCLLVSFNGIIKNLNYRFNILKNIFQWVRCPILNVLLKFKLIKFEILKTSEACISKTFDLNETKFGRVVKMPFSKTFQKSGPVAPTLHNIIFMTSYQTNPFE